MEVDYLIIGGGIAGTTAAETLRAKDSEAKIAILEDEAHTLYSRVLIPSYLKGKVAREKLFFRKLANYEASHIDFYPDTTVSSIDALRHEVSTDSKKIFSYKKLLIATGGRPKKITEVFSSTTPISPLRMHTLEDADIIKKTIDETTEKKVLVIGESFIALEFLEIFSTAGFEVHATVKENLWGGEKRFGSDGARILEDNFRRNKIILHKHGDLTFIKNDDFYLKNGDHLKSPIWALGVGINRNFSFLPELLKNKGIITLTDFLILKCLLIENNLVNRAISKKINVSLNSVGERLIHLGKIGLIKRIEADKGPGIINFIEPKNKKKIEDFLKILNENSI